MGALEQFESGVAEVRLLLELSGRGEADEVVAQDNALRRSGVVLLVSHFESYLKSVAEEFVDSIGSGQLEARQIPRGIKELHTLPKFVEILESNNDSQRAVLLKKLPPITALWNDSAKPSPGTLSPALLGRQVTNADSLTIDKLYGLMGSNLSVCDGDIDIPSPNDGSLESVNIRLGLKDLVKCRNDIAHGDMARKPTNEDLERYLQFLTALAERLHRKADALTAICAL